MESRKDELIKKYGFYNPEFDDERMYGGNVSYPPLPGHPLFNDGITIHADGTITKGDIV